MDAELIEKVAIEMHAVRPALLSWRDEWEGVKDGFRRQAEVAIAALRAQVKAEPVAWRWPGGVWQDGEPSLTDRAQLKAAGVTPEWAYTAPPPDHAEALAEALQEIMSYEGGAESPLEDQYVVDRAQSALTRYKERTNG